MKNALLWKRILNEGVANPDLDQDEKDTFQRKIIIAPIIVDTRYLDEDAEEGKPWNWRRYRAIAVPFGTFWLEGTTSRGGHWGVLVEAQEKDGGWELTTNCFSCKGNHPLGYIGSLPVVLNSMGDLDPNCMEIIKSSVPASPNPLPPDLIARILASVVDNMLDALLMLGCKNVALKANNNEPEQVRRAMKRFGEQPDQYRYHTLVVRPPGSKSDSPAQEIGIMPRHVCRGHFAEYGPGYGRGLLFGKYAGRFYIPPHLKGDKRNGIVEKDYIVSPLT